VLLPADQVAPERARSAKPLPASPSNQQPPATSSTEPAMYVVGDLIAIGSPELLKPSVAADAPGLPLAALLLAEGDATVAAFALRPDGVQQWSGALSFLKDCKTAAIRCDIEDDSLTLNAIVPMPAKESQVKAAALTDAAHAFDKGIFGAAPDPAHPIDSRTLAFARIVSGTIFFPQTTATTISPPSLRGRLHLPAARLPELLADFLTFSTPRAALDANLLARSTACSPLFLASLTPHFRQAGAASDAFRPEDLTTPEVGRQYYVDTASEGPDRAEYRLRIHDAPSKKDAQTLQIIVIRQGAQWMIDSIAPWVSANK
jgi:hypothetical protein